MSDKTCCGSPLVKKLHPIAHLLLRVLIGVIFLQSGWEKLHHLPAFYQAAQNYKLLPPMLTHFYAVCLPWLEMMAGGYLIAGLFMRFAAGLTGVLLISFMIAIGVALARGEAVDCGCYIGGRSEPVTIELFLRDLGLLVGCLYLLWKPHAPWSLDNALEDSKTPAALT